MDAHQNNSMAGGKAPIGPFHLLHSRYSSEQYFRALQWVCAVVAIHILLIYGFATAVIPGLSIQFDIYTPNFWGLYVILFACFIYLYPFFIMVFVRPEKLFRYVGGGFRWHLISRERLFFSFPILLLIPIVQSVYSSFKVEIPNLIPFAYDELFYRADQWLLGGTDPWRILHAWLGDPLITNMIDVLYHVVWMYVLIGVVVWHATGQHALRTKVQFFVSYIVIWGVLGNLAALFLSSAGPCYYSNVTGMSSPYEELMLYLQSIGAGEDGLWALQFQNSLWQGYMDDVPGYGGGISAMPSLHVATTVLFALSIHKINVKLGALFFLYALIIWIGSVHLAWHYAVDGLIAIILTWLIWIIVGRLVDLDRLLGEKSKPQIPVPA